MDLSIREGEFFSILGSSGSGKTTTLRMIAGFEQPTTGSVLLDGVDATGVPPYRRDVNTVFQNYALFPHMKVEANVAYPLKMAGPRADDQAAGGGSARAGRHDRLREAASAPALRRPAPARRPGPGADRQPPAAAPRRAAGRTRPEAAREHAAGPQTPPARGRDHLHLRHPRSGRGAGDERPAGGHERRPGRAAGDADRGLRQARRPRSSPASSARPTCSSARASPACGPTPAAVAIALAEEPDEQTFTLSVRPEAIVTGEESRGLATTLRGRSATSSSSATSARSWSASATRR